jgi:methylenetetrahydrofolate dehydrogenase (NADP+)/methenyltetrahydrofolate cyclohydrolase
MILKDIKEYRAAAIEKLKDKVSQMEIKPSLAIIQVGDNEASNRYVRNKIRDCESVDIDGRIFKFSEDVLESTLLDQIKEIQKDYDSIIVQLPLPKHISVEKVTAAIDPSKDVDGFTANSKFTPCTPGGIMKYLEYCGWDPIGKNVVIIGRSDIVGKPMAKLMTDADATVTLCHSRTKNLWKYIEAADLIICAVGKKEFLNCYSIHVPVIDVGINFTNEGKLVGDCFNTENRDVTPVPGGVGLLTRLALLENVVFGGNNK